MDPKHQTPQMERGESRDTSYMLELDEFDFYEGELLPKDEFAESFKGAFCCAKSLRNIGRDTTALYSATMSFYQQVFASELVTVISAAVGMTLFFCYYWYSGPTEEKYHLAARLRFDIIGKAVLFPSIMLVGETIKRRNDALQRFATIKSEMCQILDAFLTWRSPNIVMPPEWEQKAYATMIRMVLLVYSLLLQPTLRDRHMYSKRGRIFTGKVLRQRKQLKSEFMKAMFQLHCLVEDLKEAGLTPMESIRLFQYIDIFSRNLEVVYSIKHYRTSQSTRSFSRIVVASCLLFYGPYFSFVAGSIEGQGGVNVAFACVLCAFTALVLLAIVAQHRAAEDPFVWYNLGNAVDVRFEAKDILMKMDGIYRVHRSKRKRNSHS